MTKSTHTQLLDELERFNSIALGICIVSLLVMAESLFAGSAFGIGLGVLCSLVGLCLRSICTDCKATIRFEVLEKEKG